jgi:hypothetical protein
MHPFYPALLMLLPLALAAPNKPRRSAEERLDAVESLARHALARLDDLEERVTKMEQPTTAMKDEIAAVKAVAAAHADILTEHSRLFTNYSEAGLRASFQQSAGGHLNPEIPRHQGSILDASLGTRRLLTRDWFAPAGTRSCRYSLEAVKKHCEAHSAAGSS